LTLHQRGKGTRPDELTKVSDSGKCRVIILKVLLVYCAAAIALVVNNPEQSKAGCNVLLQLASSITQNN